MLRVFFFQAEDGIRDLVRSRGLGDVYKRQPCKVQSQQGEHHGEADRPRREVHAGQLSERPALKPDRKVQEPQWYEKKARHVDRPVLAEQPSAPIAVSYTHLRAHETVLDLVCRLLLEKKKKYNKQVR